MNYRMKDNWDRSKSRRTSEEGAIGYKASLPLVGNNPCSLVMSFSEDPLVMRSLSDSLM